MEQGLGGEKMRKILRGNRVKANHMNRREEIVWRTVKI
jgi:hypothetical protein